MKRPFVGGVLAGLVAPVLFVGSAVLFIFRATGKVPFAIADESDDQVTVKLIEPDQVTEALAPWRAKLRGMVSQLEALGDDEIALDDPA